MMARADKPQSAIAVRKSTDFPIHYEAWHVLDNEIQQSLRRTQDTSGSGGHRFSPGSSALTLTAGRLGSMQYARMLPGDDIVAVNELTKKVSLELDQSATMTTGLAALETMMSSRVEINQFTQPRNLSISSDAFFKEYPSCVQQKSTSSFKCGHESNHKEQPDGKRRTLTFTSGQPHTLRSQHETENSMTASTRNDLRRSKLSCLASSNSTGRKSNPASCMNEGNLSWPTCEQQEEFSGVSKGAESNFSWEQQTKQQFPFQTALEFAHSESSNNCKSKMTRSPQQGNQSSWSPSRVQERGGNKAEGPPIRESLKRKFQVPNKSKRIEALGARQSKSLRGNTKGSRQDSRDGGKRAAQTDEDASDDEDLPEELRRFGKELVGKIEDEIMISGDPITFSDIAGLYEAKQTLQEIVCWPMRRPDLFTGLRRAPNGLLLYGPPGTGKTLIGKAIAHESGATFFSISSSSLTSKWIGEGEKLVRTLFAVAAFREPSVVFIDEIDSMLTQRKADENEASRRIKTEFLVQLDGTGSSSQGRVLMIGATNRPQELDDAARRRFTKRLYIPLPQLEDREILLKILLGKNSHCLTEVEITSIAEDTKGFSGADLKSFCTEAAMGPIRQLGARALEIHESEIPQIDYSHCRQALRFIKPSVSPEDLTQYVQWDNTFGTRQHDGGNNSAS